MIGNEEEEETEKKEEKEGESSGEWVQVARLDGGVCNG